MTQNPALAQEFLVDDLETLKVIAHNKRLDILQTLKKPKTVKEIAKLLQLPATKLYYHVNLMEKHALIQVVETNIVSGILEKKYQIVAHHYRIDNSLLTDQPAASAELENMLSTIFEVTQAEIRRTVEKTEQNPFAEGATGILYRASLRMTPEQHADFTERIKIILDELTSQDGKEGDANKALYGLTIAYYPIHTQDDLDE
ncbi:MAG: hypothetical protein DHS20C20_05780 [Ardenticatenaceae bacterium]|nr:MAG: hypothetical protein DHS20C20_05780 [Ardenticatenaceae bacterium]